MVETGLDIPRHWVEFNDPDNPAQRLRVDLTWLTSSWTCIFGSGCRGIDAAAPWAGCCTLGAHFTDDADVARVSAAAERLTDQTWQLRSRGVAKAEGKKVRWLVADEEAHTTRVVDGACIFFNRPGFAGGAGCALHYDAILRGEPPHTTKPDVCWQLPLRRTYRDVDLPDGTSYLEITITEYDRRGWGPGGHDLDWYCSGNTEAHVGREPVFRSLRHELVELMGQGAYDELVILCHAHLRAVRSAKRTGQRPLVTLLVHPATLSAKPRRRR